MRPCVFVRTWLLMVAWMYQRADSGVSNGTGSPVAPPVLHDAVTAAEGCGGSSGRHVADLLKMHATLAEKKGGDRPCMPLSSLCAVLFRVPSVRVCPVVCQAMWPAILAGDWDTSLCIWAGFHKCPALLDSAFVAQMGLAGGISSTPEIHIPKRLSLP